MCTYEQVHQNWADHADLRSTALARQPLAVCGLECCATAMTAPTTATESQLRRFACVSARPITMLAIWSSQVQFPELQEKVVQIWSKLEGRFLLSSRFYGAGDRDRTGDIQLGKLTFYH